MATVGSLVVSLIARTQAFEREMRRSRQTMTNFQRTTAAVTKTVAFYAKGFLIGGGALYAMKKFTSAALIQEKAERDLQAAVGGSIEAFENYASHLQRLTIYGDEQILSQMAYAANLGVTRDRLKEATQAAIGLAAKYRIELNSAMMLVGRASQGQTQTLTRYGIVLDQTLSKEEQFNQLLKIGADAFRLAEEQAKDSIGALQRFRNAMGDIAEDLGEGFLPSLTTGAEKLTTAKDKFDILTTAMERYSKATGEAVGWQRKWYDLLPPIGITRAIAGAASMRNVQYPNILKMFQAQAEAGMAPGFYPPKEITQEIASKMNRLAEAERNAAEQQKRLSEEQAGAKERIGQLSDQLQKEIELTGHISDARQHARMQIEFETETLKAYGEGTVEAVEAVAQFEAQLKRLEQAQGLARIAEGIGDAFTSAFDRAATEIRNMNDALEVARALAQDIMRTVVHETVSRPAGLAIAGLIGGIGAGGGEVGLGSPGVTGAHVLHGGGVGGETSMRRNLPSSLFLTAPRYHTGLRPNEFAAVLERGETINPKGGSGPVNLHFHSPDAQGTYRLFYDNRRTIATVLRGAMNENDTLRRSER